MHLLVVGDANLCRSPLAEHLAAALAARALGGEAARVHVSSAGLAARDGLPMDPRSATVLEALGGRRGGVSSRVFDPAMAERADLVLSMTAYQRRAVLEAAPRALRHTFTLPEAADLVGRVDLTGLEELDLDVRARELASRLNRGRAHRPAVAIADVPDPLGRRTGIHQAVARQINACLVPLAAVLFSPADVRGRGRPAGADARA